MAEKAGITKRMKDTGISGRTTKALGTACVVAAPVAVAVGVGYAISKVWNAIWD